MQYQVKLTGDTPIIQHNGNGIDPQNPYNQRIAQLAAKKASQRTVSEEREIRECEVLKSLWTAKDLPTIPMAALRSCIEKAARKLKHGPRVREGLLVLSTEFTWDVEKYGTTLEEIASKCQFTVPVVVQRSRILRTRAIFETPWSLDATIEVDPELVDKNSLATWLDIAGRRVGLGDWRPEKSGVYGRFITDFISEI